MPDHIASVFYLYYFLSFRLFLELHKSIILSGNFALPPGKYAAAPGVELYCLCHSTVVTAPTSQMFI